MGHYGRVPSFIELFGQRGSITGNPSLRPEEGLQTDFGLAWSLYDLGFLDQLAFESAVFYSDIDDLIVLVRTAQDRSVPQNVGRAETLGAEIAMRATLFEEAPPHSELHLSGRTRSQRRNGDRWQSITGASPG